jgi:hypothetical protein
MYQSTDRREGGVDDNRIQEEQNVRNEEDQDEDQVINNRDSDGI